MLKYKSEVRRLYSIFFTYRNDIDLYVEDEEKDKEFYKVLFNRLMEGSSITINDVTPLGNRDIVIQTCLNDTTTDRKKLYIIDGDIYGCNSNCRTLTLGCGFPENTGDEIKFLAA